MLSDLPLIYWDACVPMSYINGIEDRIKHIEPLMSLSGKEHQLVTSVLSITEVAFARFEQDQKGLDPAAELQIAQLWNVGSPIKLVEFYEQIARDAQGLIRIAVEKGFSLKPADAIHIATADRLKVKEFHTYDKGLYKFSRQTPGGFEIVPPIAKTPLLVLSTPTALTSASSSTETELPVSQSGGDGREIVAEPAPSHPSTLPADPTQQQPDSSPQQSRPARSEPQAD